MTIIKKEK